MITTAKQSSILQGFPKYRSMLAGNSAYAPPGFESIATVTGTGSSSTITFSSIPSGFRHLQIRGIAQSASSGTDGAMRLQINSDTGTNYSEHYLQGDGSTVSSFGTANNSYIYVARPIRNSSYPSTVGVFIIDILNYTSTSQFKTIRSLSGNDINGAGLLIQHSGNWRSTSAITSISLYDPSSINYTTNTIVALYGIKEA